MTGNDPTSRLGMPVRLFWGFAEPFLTSARDASKQRGRIPRATLEQVWRWVGSDILPQHLPPLEAKVDEAIRREAVEDIARGIVEMKRLVAPVLRHTLATCEDRPEVIRKLADHIGSRHMIAHMQDICDALAVEPALGQLQGDVPFRVDDPGVIEIEQVADAVTRAAKRCPEHTDLIYVAAMQVFKNPAHALRLGHHALQTAPASLFEKSRFGIICEILLHDLSAEVAEIEEREKSVGLDGDLVDTVIGVGRSMAGIRREIEIDDPSRFATGLGRIKGRLSDMVGGHMTQLRPRLERLFGAMTDGSEAAGPDVEAGRQARHVMKAISRLGPVAGEIGITPALNEARSTAVAVMESASSDIVETIRRNEGKRRDVAMDYLRIAVDLTESLHGPDAARVVRRLGEAAGTVTASGDTIAAA